MKAFTSFLAICFSFIAIFIAIKKSLSRKDFQEYAGSDKVWVL